MLATALPLTSWAQDAAPAAALPPVVVTATRTDAAPIDVPASIDSIGGDGVRDGRLQVNISESLGGVPGLAAHDRQNYAQDVQISVRGFGARSTFGIRGVRLYVDGIPATLPDGQGQISNVDLNSVDRIEVLRGPFSALYGNSSGGVIQVFTADGSGPPTVGFSVAGGSYGNLRTSASFSGSTGALSYVGSASHFHTDGYRDHSAADRNIGNTKLTLRLDEASTLTFVANSLALPEAQDPLGLTRAEYDTEPRGVDPAATTFDTRKTVDQTQAGVIYERRLDTVNTIRAMVYDGHRNTQQFQAIPVAPQGNPLNPGGVIALGRDYQGTDLRWTAKTALVGRPFTLVAGLAYDHLDELRLGYQNFIGDMPGGSGESTLGVQGALRRDENNDVADFDQYMQVSWQFEPAWTLDAGIRHSRVGFVSTDHYIVGKNGNDSGSADYGATLPVIGLMYALDHDVRLYATAGRGFETPTLNELAYRPNGQTGLNFGLQAATSNSVEVGLKTRLAAVGDLNAALFQTRTDHEIVTQTNTGGRSTYQNAGATRRTGLELSWSQRWFESLHAQAAFTWLDAIYADGFTTCTATPCTTPNVAIGSGARMPGLARTTLFAALGWTPPQGWRGSLEARASSEVYVNDSNSDHAPGYAIASLSGGYVAHLAGWDLAGFARIDNLFDRKYAGSVIVNEGNGRFFEPAPGRNWTLGMSGSFSF